MADNLDSIQRSVWNASIPLAIRLSASECRAFDESEPYLISVPRLSYLPFLCARLLRYFSDDMIVDATTIAPDTGVFTFEGVTLRWQLPVGLLYDIHVLSTQDMQQELEDKTSALRKAVPFQLTIHFGNHTGASTNPASIPASPSIVHDMFINSVKEADFLRSGTAKPIMSLNATDSKLLWSSTEVNDLATHSRIHASLLPKETGWRNIPLRIYLPSNSGADENDEVKGVVSRGDDRDPSSTMRGQTRVIQSPIPPFVPATAAITSTARLPASQQAVAQTIGSALHSLLPSLFPSRRTPILAKPILHGAVVPMNANLEELASKASYADGWVSIVVAITS